MGGPARPQGHRPERSRAGDRRPGRGTGRRHRPGGAATLRPGRQARFGQAAPVALARWVLVIDVGDRDRGVADLSERPARRNPNVDMDTPATGGFWKARVAKVREQCPRCSGDTHGVREVGTGLWVEIEAQLVRMVNVIATDWPRMKRD